MGKRISAYQLALGGVFLALTVVSLFVASVIPGFELTFYALSSVFIGLMILETGIDRGLIVYVAAVFLGFVLIPNKNNIISFF